MIRLTIIMSIGLLTISATEEQKFFVKSIMYTHHEEITHDPRQLSLYKSILYNTSWTSGSRDSLKRYLEPIFLPIVKEYDSLFALNANELSAVLMTLATSESGNSKGQPFMSHLFKYGNNPFGIKGKGLSYATYEYYNGVRVDIHDEFAHFETIEHSIRYVLNDMFIENQRYSPLRIATNYEQFFNELYKCGYFTNPYWVEVYFIPTCKQYYL
jgi:hypothetical protein